MLYFNSVICVIFFVLSADWLLKNMKTDLLFICYLGVGTLLNDTETILNTLLNRDDRNDFWTFSKHIVTESPHT